MLQRIKKLEMILKNSSRQDRLITAFNFNFTFVYLSSFFTSLKERLDAKSIK